MAHSVAFWPTLVVSLLAAAIDIRTGRIPNWLALPFLGAGLASGAALEGWAGLLWSGAGLLVAAAPAGVLWWLRGLGMGDVKLLAGIGAWIGPSQLVSALVATAIAGGFLATGYALRRRSLGRCLDGVQELAAFWRAGLRPHPTLHLDSARVIKIPYAVAIAVGAVFSFYTV